MLYFGGAQPGSTSMNAGVNGGQWNTAAAATDEGAQNFPSYPDHGDLAQDTEDFYSLHGPEDYQQQTWGNTVAMAADSVAMHRTVSKSSAGSFKSHTIRASTQKARPRIQTTSAGGVASAFAASSLSSGSEAAYDIASSVVAQARLAGSGSAMNSYYSGHQDGSAISAMAGSQLSPGQYMSMYSQGLGSTGYGVNGISLSTQLPSMAELGHIQQHQYEQQHVDPTCTQMHMDYNGSPSAITSHTWDSSSSRRSSPGLAAEDTWSPSVVPSPSESQDSAASSPFGQAEFRLSLPYQQQQQHRQDQQQRQPEEQKENRSNSEGESARDHPLYKDAVCQGDGYYHCPWEGKDSCNHRPEKLKCNYEPYRCKHNSCENARFSSTACLLRHEREAHAMHGHGDKPYLCLHESCDRSQPGFGFPRQWNLKDHMRRVHRDDGSQLPAASTSQVATSSAVAPGGSNSSQAASKGRKRKKDTSASELATTSSSRKSSASKGSGSRRSSNSASRQAEAEAAAAAAAEAAAAEAAVAAAAAARMELLNEWQQHKTAVSTIFTGLGQPTDPEVLQQLRVARSHIDAIHKISADLLPAGQEPSYMQSYVQQAD